MLHALKKKKSSCNADFYCMRMSELNPI